ncbi:hypothetical protein ACGF12_21320 [Kitasatospora sp. NPDC048296]
MRAITAKALVIAIGAPALPLFGGAATADPGAGPCATSAWTARS